MILPKIASSSTYEEIMDSPHIVEIDSPQIMNQPQEKACITAYASGAGIGGVVGFGFKAILYDYLGLGLSVTVWSAVVFAFAYAFIYLNGLQVIMDERERIQILMVESSAIVDDNSDPGPIRSGPIRRHRKHRTEGSGGLGLALSLADAEFINHFTVEHDTDSTISNNFTALERFMLVLSLWPYMIPMFTVYAAEYTLQAGVWSAIGFPVTSASARAEFYQYANWMVSEIMSY
jgi:battenin